MISHLVCAGKEVQLIHKSGSTKELFFEIPSHSSETSFTFELQNIRSEVSSHPPKCSEAGSVQDLSNISSS